ncbi:MAG: phosphodiester glycosidase family protein [Gemmatimonadota bacterium]|nr:phosphodiester glycosidase family protein [Gemmatimonadota bacterium]
MGKHSARDIAGPAVAGRRWLTLLAVGFAVGSLMPSLLPGQRLLAPGLTYSTQRDAGGPWNIHVVRIDLRAAALSLQAVRATDQLRGRERVSHMAARLDSGAARVRVAINADFFDLASGENENNQVLAGEWWKGLKVTDSPFDTFDNAHAQLSISASGRAAIDRYQVDARAWSGGAMLPIITVNARRADTPEGMALYTPRFGVSTPAGGPGRDSASVPTEATLRRAGVRGDTTLYVRVGAVRTGAGSPIPPDGAVLVAHGARASAVQALRDGDTVRVLLTTTPRVQDGRAPALLVGGWPQLLRGGIVVAGDAATIEGTISRNAEMRHPRSAVGVSRDGRTVWLYVVDGRSTASVGMTLVELAEALRRLGVWDALNFDGGGSTALVVDGHLVNVPSDPAGERAVGNAVLVMERRRP